MSEQRLKQEFRKQQNSLKNINNINSNNSEKKQSPLRPKTPPQVSDVREIVYERLSTRDFVSVCIDLNEGKETK